MALKVLPFAAVLDRRQIARFYNEAQAAAHLNHPHIVPVFAVGCERRVHYYAMQYIEGRALDVAIAQLRGLAGPAKPGPVRFGATPFGPFRQIGPVALFRKRLPAETAVQGSATWKALAGSVALRGSGYFRTAAQLGVQAAEATRLRRTSAGSSIATSNRRTCCSTTRANCGSPTSAWPASTPAAVSRPPAT